MNLKNKIICIVVGVLIIILGINLLGSSNAKKKVCTEEISATITGITTETSVKRTNGKRKRSTSHDVYVSYEYNGQTYSGVKLDYYSSGMDRGDTVELHINPNNPTEYYSEGSSIAPFLCIGLGIIFVIASLLSNGNRITIRIPASPGIYHESSHDKASVEDRLSRL